MFNLHDYLMTGFRNAVGKRDDYWVVTNSVGWMEKGVLTDTDMAELQAMIDEKNKPKPEPEIIEPEMPMEDMPTEDGPVAEEETAPTENV